MTSTQENGCGGGKIKLLQKQVAGRLDEAHDFVVCPHLTEQWDAQHEFNRVGEAGLYS